MPPTPLKLVLIADIHIGSALPQPCTRLPERARSLLKYVVSKVNAEVRPSFVVQLGDLIEAEESETDEENYSTGLEVLGELTAPCFHVMGNHDQCNLSLEQLTSLLKRRKFYYSFDVGSFHFVVLFGKSSADHGPVAFDEEQRRWLEQDLAAIDKPVIVFTHFSLHDEENDESPTAEKGLCTGFSVEQRQKIRSILATSGKVRAVFSGHLHRNELSTVDSICYVSIQSLVQNISPVRKDASESFAVVSLAESSIKVEVEGMDPAEYHF